MNRNQKIAIGCGAAGCLGLIVLVIACAVGFYLMRSTTTNSNRSSVNVNRSSTRNSNDNTNDNSNDNSNTSTSGEETTTSSSSMSEDDKHKLFQAAGSTQDSELMQRVLRKLNFIRADGTPTDEYSTFLKNHISWAVKNVEFIQSINTPEKARAYVDAHMND